ncbi:MAG: hypothetical protein ACOCYN_05055 [Planctomycetota bacterium]
MRVLHPYGHPQATGFHAAIRTQVDGHALDHPNVASERDRRRSLDRIERAMREL